MEVVSPAAARARFRAGLRVPTARWAPGFAQANLVIVPQDADLVAFLTGCSFTFERALLAAGVPLRHLEHGGNVAMYITSRSCRGAGRFSGPLVVSMRPVPAELVTAAAAVTAGYPAAHGAPVHVGDPEALGIADLSRPDFGEPVAVGQGEVPVFWACGVTPQVALAAAGLPLAITHAPGHMLITDVPDDELSLRR